MISDSNFRLAIVAIFGIVFVAAIGLSIYFDPMCHDELLSTVVSPNRSMAASVFLRDCGATTHEYTHVVIHKAAKSFASGEFIAGADYERPMELTWTSDSDLLIHCRCDVGRFNSKQEVDGIKISVTVD